MKNKLIKNKVFLHQTLPMYEYFIESQYHWAKIQIPLTGKEFFEKQFKELGFEISGDFRDEL